MIRLLLKIAIVLFALNSSHSFSESIEPLGIIQSTTDKVLSKIESDKDKLKDNPGEMYNLVSDLVFPHFDFAVMSRFV